MLADGELVAGDCEGSEWMQPKVFTWSRVPPATCCVGCIVAAPAPHIPARCSPCSPAWSLRSCTVFRPVRRNSSSVRYCRSHAVSTPSARNDASDAAGSRVSTASDAAVVLTTPTLPPGLAPLAVRATSPTIMATTNRAAAIGLYVGSAGGCTLQLFHLSSAPQHHPVQRVESPAASPQARVPQL